VPLQRITSLSDSIFLQELGKGDVGLRFAPELEAQYRLRHLQRVRLRVRVWFTAVAALNLGFSIANLMMLLFSGSASESRFGGILAHVLVSTPFALLMLWLVWSRQYLRYYLSWARAILPLDRAVSAAFVAEAMMVGRVDELAMMAVFVVAPYFFSGLLFRTALFVNVVTLIAFGAAALLVGMPHAELIKALMILTTISTLCAIVCRDSEQMNRRSFLETALLEEYGTRDGLSGLMNRAAFDEHLLRVWQQALRDGRTLSLLMIDIDHFKSYNDTYGHQAGDAALRRVAQVLKEFARRPLDTAARYGGEEFALILYDLPRTAVEDIAERARDAVQLSGEADIDAVRRIPQTVSIGVAMVMPMMNRTPAGAIQLADQALYEAKRTGRNRVVVKGLDEFRALKTGSFQAVAGSV
jgi:diguanylate cyclase (GGDEF)-like protein